VARPGRKCLGGGSSSLADVEFTPALSRDDWNSLGANASTAQDVADWIADNPSATLANQIDWKVEDSGTKADVTGIAAGSSVSLDDGYWLVSSEDSSPILVLVGGGVASKVTEKAEAPTLAKYVRAEGGAWSSLAIAGAGVGVQYKLVGTLPRNYDSFPTYSYRFDDARDPSILIDPSSVRVYLGGEDGTDITSSASVSCDKTSLTVSFDDLKQVLPSLGDKREVTVTYSATLGTDATLGLASPNDNQVTLTYPRRPTSATAKAGRSTVRLRPAASVSTMATLATTPAQQAQAVTWGVTVDKVDSVTGKRLKGAGFTVQDAKGRYVNTDGTATRDCVDASVWTTGDEGTVLVHGLSNGDCTFTEVNVPDGYQAADPVKITLSGDGSDLKAISSATVEKVDSATGTCMIKIGDAPTGSAGGITSGSGPAAALRAFGRLPQTGDPTSWLGVLFLVLVGIAAIAVARRLRRRDPNGGEA
jgi:fimbrial isopeptide formation D2 family protein/LPXTG-motif cell wall-anchored protein